MPFKSLSILYEDNHLLVVSKPPGIATQAEPSGNLSLEEVAKALLKEKYHKKGAVFLHPIHRLDKPVSGIVVFAKTSKALTRLNASIREGKTGKIYHCQVEGILKQKEGCLEHYLSHGHHRAMLSSQEAGKPSKLKYRVLQEKGGISLLQIALETGRYHQIRLQLSTIGHPIVGDFKYGSTMPYPISEENIQAIALHHAAYSIPHPITHSLITFEDLPKEGWIRS